MRTSILLLSLAAAGGGIAASLPDPNLLPTRPVLTATPVALLFAGMDSNGDARITHAEARAAEERMFQAADGDHDGSLGLIELADWSQAWLGDQSAVPGRFDFDRNGDDKISKAEFIAELERRFAGFDKNSDGVIERSELITVALPPSQGKRDRQSQQAPQRPGSSDGR